MANWYYQTIEMDGIGEDFKNGKFQIPRSLADDIEVSGPNCVEFNTRGCPAYDILSNISKTQYPGKDMVVTIVDEGSLFLQGQMKFQNGVILAERSRLDGEEFPEWNAMPEEESNRLVQHARSEHRAAEAEARFSFEEPVSDMDYEMS